MNTSTLVAVSVATFALGYLQALTDLAKWSHPGWFLLAVAVVGLSIVIHKAEDV